MQNPSRWHFAETDADNLLQPGFGLADADALQTVDDLCACGFAPQVRCAPSTSASCFSMVCSGLSGTISS